MRPDGTMNRRRGDASRCHRSQGVLRLAARRRGAAAARLKIEGPLERSERHEPVRPRLRHPLSRRLQIRCQSLGRADARRAWRRALAERGRRHERAGRRDRASASRRMRRSHRSRAHARMERAHAAAAAGGLARAGAEREVAPDRSQPQGAVGPGGYHAVRPWPPLQPLAAGAPPEGGHVLAGGLAACAVHAAVLVARAA